MCICVVGSKACFFQKGSPLNDSLSHKNNKALSTFLLPRKVDLLLKLILCQKLFNHSILFVCCAQKSTKFKLVSLGKKNQSSTMTQAILHFRRQYMSKEFKMRFFTPMNTAQRYARRYQSDNERYHIEELIQDSRHSITWLRYCNVMREFNNNHCDTKKINRTLAHLTDYKRLYQCFFSTNVYVHHVTLTAST